MLFGTSGIRGKLDEVNPEFAQELGRCFGTYMRRKKLREVVVGRDTRITSEMLLKALISGLLSCGIEVLDFGLVPTPVLAHFAREAGVMVTASHNPESYNGLKFFREKRELYPKEEREIENIFEKRAFKAADWNDVESVKRENPIPEYIKDVLNYARREFGFTEVNKKVVLDCGGGVGNLVLPELLLKMGCEVTTLNSHLTGFFKRPPEPKEENISELCNLVRETKADLGIAQDGDADRINLVDERGEVVPEDSVIALLAYHYASEDDVVVTSIDTSFRIDEYLSGKKVKVKRVMLGNLHEGVKKHNAIFAGEPWKHVHVKFGCHIDGFISSVILLILLKKRGVSTRKLFEKIENFFIFKESVSLGRKVSLSAFKRELKKMRDLREIIEISGVRANFKDNSWILVRPSGTERKLRIVVEARSKKRLNEHLDFLKSAGCLDTTTKLSR
ncbi:MAG: phosphoglucosamine mutase [Candidatus Methanofastidiosia archaeon]